MTDIHAATATNFASSHPGTAHSSGAASRRTALNQRLFLAPWTPLGAPKAAGLAAIVVVRIHSLPISA